MKIFYLSVFILALLCQFIDVSGQNKVIDRPYVEKSSTEHLFINKLELNDAEVILYGDAYHLRNYWVKIVSDSHLIGKSGKKYKLLRSEQFELDKEVYMPDSGTRPFVLYFEGLDKEDDVFDFVEGDDKVEGIHIKEVKSDAPIQCLIKGETIDRPQSNMLYLTPKGGDTRVKRIAIPIKDGRFEYLLNADEVEAYELTFRDEQSSGGWRPIVFFAENGILEMKLFPMERYKENILTGSPLTDEYVKYVSIAEAVSDKLYTDSSYDLKNKNTDSDKYSEMLKAVLESQTIGKSKVDVREELSKLWDEDRYMNDDAKILLWQSDSLETEDERRKALEKFYAMQDSKKHLSDEALALEKEMAVTEQIVGDWELQYMTDNVSLVGYERLINRFKRSTSYHTSYFSAFGKSGDYISLFNAAYAKKYPNHPYTKQMEMLIASYTSVKVGGEYLDFTVPDFKGNMVVLSEEIEGKIALLDLWASWCGPCRRLSMSMIPVYEEFKDKGFTVVGVAREEKAEYGINAAKKDKYPWVNLLELKDAGKIWEKYGAGNSGGQTYLIDKDGTILVIHPTAEEVRQILKEKLE